jgi:hypothetical protein
LANPLALEQRGLRFPFVAKQAYTA